METTAPQVRDRVRPLLSAGKVVVTGGFVGATRSGVATTLGRGGSDYSAAILGAALDAAEIQIWTDVDGMLSADPRVVESPFLVPALSFAEAAELAYFGAKVLHPKTIQPAASRNIPVRILNTFKPSAGGTIIANAGASDPAPVTALACKKGITVVTITSTGMLMAHGYMRRIFEVFERFRTSVDVVSTSEVSVSVTIDDATHLEGIVSGLSAFADVSVASELALVAVVGEGYGTDPRAFTRVVRALEGIPLRLVSQADARRNVTLVIDEDDLPRAMGQLHAEFFRPAPHPSKAASEVSA
jgi:aspartate kinase